MGLECHEHIRLVSVIQGPMNHKTLDSVYLIPRDGGKVQRLCRATVILLLREGNKEDWPRHRGLISHSFGEPRTWTRLADREMVDELLSEPFVLSFLICSEGGYVPFGRALQGLAEQASQHDDVTAYVGDQAGSAAADVFQSADTRYGLRSSSFLWHPTRKASPEKASRDFQEYADFLSREVKPEDSGRLEVQLHHVQSPDVDPRYELEFSGAQLRKYGIIHRTFDHVGTLRRKFERDVGLSLDERGMPRAIAQFFEE